LKIVIIGSEGQLGSELVDTFQSCNNTVIGLSHKEINIEDNQSVKNGIASIKPDMVINCAAYVLVDKAEVEPLKAFEINGIGSLNIAKICNEIKSSYTYISTDYVFPGNKKSAYLETDNPDPINVYGVSKLIGENLARQACNNTLIVRVSSLFGKAGSKRKGGNFIEAIIAKAKSNEKIQVVNDTYISPTYTQDAANVISNLINKKEFGIVHVTNSNSQKCTWYSLAQKVLDLCDLQTPIEPVSSNSYKSAAPRPKNSSLSNRKAKKLTNLPIPDWEDAVKRYLNKTNHLK